MFFNVKHDSKQTNHPILYDSTLAIQRSHLLVRSLLRLSVLDLTTPQPLHLTIRKSSLLRLLRDLLSLLSLLLNISNRHADNSSLHLERLLATTLALLSSLPSSPSFSNPTSDFLLLRLQAVVQRMRAGLFFCSFRERHFLFR